MIKQICHIIHGYLIWLRYKMRFKLDQHTVLLILTGEDRRLDAYALLHLEDHVRHKIGRASCRERV